MSVRLAFAVAAHLDCEILIVDEVLAVGDAEFQEKCLGKMGGVIKDEGKTILFVSHDMNAVSKLCNKTMLLESGALKTMGKTEDIVNLYLESYSRSQTVTELGRNSGKPVYFKKVYITNAKGEPCNNFFYDEPIYFHFDMGVNDPKYKCDLFVTLLNAKKRPVFSCEHTNINSSVTLKLEPKQLVRGSYSLDVFIQIPWVVRIDMAEDICGFTVIDNGSEFVKHRTHDYGDVFARYAWE